MAQPKNPEDLPFEKATDNYLLGEDRYVLHSQKDGIKNEKVKDIQQDREERKKYAKLIFWFICAWVSLVLIMMFFIGFGICKLSDKVIITLLTTTTADILTLFYLVTKYLFTRGLK